MRASLTLTVTALILLASTYMLRGQEHARLWRSYTDSLLLPSSDTLRLSHQFVQSNEIHIKVVPPFDSHSASDVRLVGREGLLILSPAFRARLAEGGHTLTVTYRALPFRFAPEYRRRTLTMRRDSVRGDSIQVAAPAQPMNIESIFGSELTKSGYIGRGFTVGNDRDLNITSGFRLQLSGKLSDDINIVGALTDENTPIQPEGNTRTIQELDKVFIKISSRDLAATLGDFNLSYTDTEFGRYNRKLSGVLGEAALRDAAASLSYASLKGNYNSMQFNGIDGVQGPYRLTASNGKQPVLVLAGTERVYVDGVAMVRGESNDYVIEYANGELSFTPKRLITSYSRITVDYEYAEREYTRTMVTASTNGVVLDSRLTMGARFIQESDDPDNPIDQPLDDADRTLLADAGDDASLAARSGAVLAGFDTAKGVGKGQYALIDTLIGGEARQVFRYMPGSDSATWSVTFSFVGSGRGEYRRKALGVFEYAGAGAGDYAPRRQLPLPRLHRVLDFHAGFTPVRNLTLSGEIGLSVLDQNRLSNRDKEDDAGNAVNLTGSWKSAQTPLGILDLHGKYRTTGSTFAPIDRVNDIEFSRKWDLATPSVAREELSEAGLNLTPSDGLMFNGGVGRIRQGEFSSLRFEGGVNLSDVRKDSARPDASWRVEYIGSEDGVADTRGRWLRQLMEAKQQTRYGTPRLRIEHEHRTARAIGGDSLLGQSQSFLDIRPGILFSEIGGLNLGADVGVRFEDAVLDGALVRRSTDMLQQYTMGLRSWNDLSANVTLTIRDRMYSDAFVARGEQNLQTILTRGQTRYSPLNGAVTTDLLYEVSTERTSRLERVYLKVPVGQGSYVYVSDLNGNGVEDENEFEPTRYDGEYILVNVPTDELFPVIDLKSSLRLRLQPDRFIEMSPTFWAGALRSFSGETFFRIDEKSEDEHTSDIYLLKLSRFLDDSTTVSGLQNFRQDVFLFERASDFSLRLRFDERRGFSKYALATERSYRREQSARIKTQLVREIGLQTDLVLLSDAVLASDGGSRARDIRSVELVADLSYRPWPQLEIGFVVTSRSATDSNPDVPVEATISSQLLRGIASFDGPGRVRVELERNDVAFSSEVDRFPYELTDGRAEGLSWVWRVNFDYRLTAFMQATLSWIGRSETDRRTIHTARAEVKAFF